MYLAERIAWAKRCGKAWYFLEMTLGFRVADCVAERRILSATGLERWADTRAGAEEPL